MSLMDRMACWSARNVIDLYVDGRLTPPAKGRVDRHLSGCGSCRDAVRAMAPVKMAKQKIAPPPGLAEAIAKEFKSMKSTIRQAAGVDQPFGIPIAWRLAPAQVAALVYLALLAAGHAAPGPYHQGPPQRAESGIEQ